MVLLHLKKLLLIMVENRYVQSVYQTLLSDSIFNSSKISFHKLMSYIQLTALTDEAAGLASQLTALQQEEDRLSARFEQEFDMTSLQAAIGDTMVKPTNDQYVYIDLSEQDSVVLYGQEEKVSGPAGVLSGAQEVFRNIVDYFR